MIETSPDNALGVATSPFTSAQGAIDAAHDLPSAVEFLTTFWIEQGLPFTSGHITHAIREARQDIAFRQATVGEILRARFEQGDLPSYDDGTGNPVRPIRTIRYTQRTDTRTPVGHEVYVYGAYEYEVDDFDFELNIAEAPMVMDGLGNQVSAAAALLGATPKSPGNLPAVTTAGTVAVAMGRSLPGTPVAIVHSDGRLCIPKAALEALAFQTGTPVKGGDALYLTVAGNTATINRDPNQGVLVRPTTDRCRLHITVPHNPQVGASFPVSCGPNGLTISL